MEITDLEPIVQVVAITGGGVAVLLTVMEIVDTYLDIGKNLRERRHAGKECVSKTIQQESSDT